MARVTVEDCVSRFRDTTESITGRGSTGCPCSTKQCLIDDDTPRPCDDYGHKFSSTWVQMAIIAMNSASEASAAASWIRVLNMGSLPGASNSNTSGRVPVGR